MGAGGTLRSHKPWKIFLARVLLIPAGILCSTSMVGADCPQALGSGPVSQPKLSVMLYVQGRLMMRSPSRLMERGKYISPEQRWINRCSGRLTATTLSDTLPERLNVFAYKSEAARSGAFVGVSSVDQKMAMEKTGPDWHAYVTAFGLPNTVLDRFVGALASVAGHAPENTSLHSLYRRTGKGRKRGWKFEEDSVFWRIW